ncbi:MAG: hypothetical protein KKG99_10100 [Bacteroidetes bacterium]|nr:hypothetical protein [Bacteroidota bacterium]
MKNILLIAYTYPPIPYGGTYRSLRFSKNSVTHDINLHVLTIDIYDDIPNDYNLLRNIPEKVFIHRTPIIDPWRRYQLLRKKLVNNPMLIIIDKIISQLLRFVSIPDHMVLWIFSAIPAALKIIKQNKIQSVIISSPPNSSLIIGYVLKKMTNVKFISDLRDPIVGNIAELNLMKKSNNLLILFEKKFRDFFNNLIIKSSDTVITNTETHGSLLKKDFPDKSHCIITVRNSYDEDDYKCCSPVNYGHYAISHLGSMYGLRNARIIFQAIKMLENDVKPDALNMKLHFYGLSSFDLEEDAKQSGVENYVEVHGLVPHQKAIQMMISSNTLLLVKAIGEGALGQIPGKFFEYVGSGRKIICIGPEESEVANIIQHYGFGIVVESDVNKVFEFLKNDYLDYCNGKCNYTPDINDLKFFGANEMTRKILSCL